MHGWARRMFPINRSITGEGVRQTLSIIGSEIDGLRTHEIPSGTSVLDWTIPEEWNVEEAYIETRSGERVVDFADHNLHLVGYSEPVDAWVNLETLQAHLYSLPDQPDAIPYVTSYYKRDWGFCLTHKVRERLSQGQYRVVIRSSLAPGILNYGDLLLKGSQTEEVLISSYICHPSMANNELSGPVVAIALARWLIASRNLRYSYRFVFIPENIGSIVYLSRHHQEMKDRIIAGFILTCIGDDRTYSMLKSRRGDTLADRVGGHVLKNFTPGYQEYDFLWPNRGTDSRNYCSPAIDLPVVDIMRSKYGTYPEYHTSLDDLDLITPSGLEGGFEVVRRCIEILERNHVYGPNVIGEPQLGRRGLYPTTSYGRATYDRKLSHLMNVLAYADGEHDLIALAERIGTDAITVADIAERLVGEGILQVLR